MMTSADLLREAAEALDQGDNPFSASRLGEHDVTSDQCMVWPGNWPSCARIVAAGIEKPRSAQGIAMLAIMAESP